MRKPFILCLVMYGATTVCDTQESDQEPNNQQSEIEYRGDLSCERIESKNQCHIILIREYMTYTLACSRVTLFEEDIESYTVWECEKGGDPIKRSESPEGEESFNKLANEFVARGTDASKARALKWIGKAHSVK